MVCIGAKSRCRPPQWATRARSRSARAGHATDSSTRQMPARPATEASRHWVAKWLILAVVVLKGKSKCVVELFFRAGETKADPRPTSDVSAAARIRDPIRRILIHPASRVRRAPKPDWAADSIPVYIYAARKVEPRDLDA